MRERSKRIKWSILMTVLSIILGSIIWKISGYEINKVFLIEGIILIIVGSMVAAKENAERIALEKAEEKRKAKIKKKQKIEKTAGIAYGYYGIAILVAGIVCILISKFI